MDSAQQHFYIVSPFSSRADLSLAKRLADNNKRVRVKAIELVRRWLSSGREISELDMLKLWKGLYYCFWMSDKTDVRRGRVGWVC